MSGDLVGNIRREIEFALYKRYSEALGEVRFGVILLPEHLCPPSEMERATVPVPGQVASWVNGGQKMDVALPSVPTVFIARELWSGGGLWAWVWHGRADSGDVYYAMRPAPAYGGKRP